MEYLKRRRMEMSRLFEELDRSKNIMMTYEEERHMLQQRLHELESVRNDMRHHKEYLLRDDIDNPEYEHAIKRYAALSEEYVQVKNSLESSSMKQQNMQMKMMELEKEVSHRMKIIEQENSADS
jgi:chromosome segregation ATPase